MGPRVRIRLAPAQSQLRTGPTCPGPARQTSRSRSWKRTRSNGPFDSYRQRPGRVGKKRGGDRRRELSALRAALAAHQATHAADILVEPAVTAA
jgi:hypothetical protein